MAKRYGLRPGNLPRIPRFLKLIVARAFRMHALEEQNRQLQRQSNSPLAGVIATDEAMLKVCRMVEKVAPTDVSVLILGESGTGGDMAGARYPRLCSLAIMGYGLLHGTSAATFNSFSRSERLLNDGKGAFYRRCFVADSSSKREMAEGGYRCSTIGGHASAAAG